MKHIVQFAQSEEQVTFPCPCGGIAVAFFVLPTDKERYAIIGGCAACKARGDNPTTVAYLSCVDNGEKSRHKRFRETSTCIYREAA